MTATQEDAATPDYIARPAHNTGRRVADFAPADAAAVARMFTNSEQSWPGGFNSGVEMTAEQVLRNYNERRPLAVLIAWEGEVAAGYCSLYEYSGEPGHSGYVGLLNADPAFQGRGVGRDLLREALNRCVARGYKRVDLGTWPGNMKAVPLYKKSGYVWVPETDVHMENYMPLLLGIPALADFWREADWYTAQVRDLSVAEDLVLDGGMRVYPYEFRHGERFVKATIDATARGLTALETERWRIACIVDDRRLIVGRPRTLRWEIENRSGTPLPITLIATASGGLHTAKEETVVVADRYATEAPLSADPAYTLPAFGERGPRVESLLLIDGLPVRLETGVEIKHPIELRLEPRRVSLIPGLPRRLSLRINNNMDAAMQARLRLTASPALRLSEPQADDATSLTLDVGAEAGSYGGATLVLSAREAGVHTLEARASVEVDGETIEMTPITLPLPAAGPGEAAVLETGAILDDNAEEMVSDREVRVEMAGQRLVVRRRRGEFHLEDAASGVFLIGGRIEAGPPCGWLTQAHVRHEVTVERDGGAVSVILRGPLPHRPEAVVEHALRLTPDGLLRVQSSIANAGDEPRAFQCGIVLWEPGALPSSVLPTVYGLVAADDADFPDWNDPTMQDPAQFAESWLARQNEDRVAGLIWGEVARITLDRWIVANAVQETGTLAPGAQRALPPVYIYAGLGDWRTVRAHWRRLMCPDAPAQHPPVREIVELEAIPVAAALTAGQAQVALSTLAYRATAGEIAFEAPDGWEIAPATHSVENLRVGRPHELSLTVRRRDGAPRAAALRAYLRGDRAVHTIFDGALIDLGDTSGTVALSEAMQHGHRTVTIDNGYLRLRLAPDFLASAIALETVEDGVNHLLSAFPTAREFDWMRPWYGGLHAVVYRPGGEFPTAGRLYEETFTAEETASPGRDGRRWRGLTARSMLHTAGLRGLELAVSYLTLPGSNVVALRATVRNHTDATLPVDTALLGYLQIDGTTDGAELLHERRDRSGRTRTTRLLRAHRFAEVTGDGWCAVHQPRSGRTMALVSGGDGEARAIGVDAGDLGAHLAARAMLRLGPNDEQSLLAFLVLCDGEDEARAYRALAGAKELL